QHRLQADDRTDLPAGVAEVVEVEREIGQDHAEPEEGEEVGDGDAAAGARDARVSQEARDGASRAPLRRARADPRGGVRGAAGELVERAAGRVALRSHYPAPSLKAFHDKARQSRLQSASSAQRKTDPAPTTYALTGNAHSR